MRDILSEIAEKTALDLEIRKAHLPEALLMERIAKANRKPRSLYASLKKEGVRIIAEIKKASPSKGMIRADLDPEKQARAYELGGAAAISVLTEEHYFLGSLEILEQAANVVNVPVLRKDFIVDRYQIAEAAASGADALLLIAALLPDDAEFKTLLDLTHEFGLEALCEAHTLEEAKRIIDLGAKIIGVNCRDLRTFKVYPEKSEEVLASLPSSCARVAESGVRSPADLKFYPSADAFLIGETLVRSDDPEALLKEFTREK